MEALQFPFSPSLVISFHPLPSSFTVWDLQHHLLIVYFCEAFAWNIKSVLQLFSLFALYNVIRLRFVPLLLLKQFYLRTGHISISSLGHSSDLLVLVIEVSCFHPLKPRILIWRWASIWPNCFSSVLLTCVFSLSACSPSLILCVAPCHCSWLLPHVWCHFINFLWYPVFITWVTCIIPVLTWIDVSSTTSFPMLSLVS